MNQIKQMTESELHAALAAQDVSKSRRKLLQAEHDRRIMARYGAALETYSNRQSRAEHPAGEFDKAGRWYPHESEQKSCCTGIRSPSKNHPYSLLTHCRTVEHVAAVHGLDPAKLRKLVRAAAKEGQS